VSRLVLETRAADETEGTRIEFAGGRLVSVKPAGLPPGTTITVSDLFYSVPARRKFLKSETTELGHIASLATHYALAHPDRQFVLRTPTQEIMNVAPATEKLDGDAGVMEATERVAVENGAAKEERGIPGLAERVYQLFGRAALDELLEIPATS